MSRPSTDLFRIITPACPACVWRALTTIDEHLDFLYGMTVCGEWRAGSTVSAGVPDGPQLVGEVLRADVPSRLSYTLGDTVDEPSVYVTWVVCAGSTGTVVGLYVDDPDESVPGENEVAWQPVLAALDRRLQHGCSCQGQTTAPDHDS